MLSWSWRLLAMGEWLMDMPQDEIVVASGSALGLNKLSAAAELAERDGAWWRAGRLWAIACEMTIRVAGSAGMGDYPERSLAAISQFLESPKASGEISSSQLDDVYDLQIAQFRSLGVGMGPAFWARLEEVQRVLATSAATRDPISAVTLHALLGFADALAGDLHSTSGKQPITHKEGPVAGGEALENKG